MRVVTKKTDATSLKRRHYVAFRLPTLGGWGVFLRYYGILDFIKRHTTEQDAERHLRDLQFRSAVGDVTDDDDTGE